MALSARALTVVLAAVAVAACSPTKKEECSSGQIICPTGCADPLTDPANCGTCMNACPPTATCSDGACVCPNAGEVVCNGACVPATAFASDPANCGGCGIACGFGTCVGGGCQCQGGLLCADQNPRCVHPLTDPANCGRCGNVCETVQAGSQCANGACTCQAPLPSSCGTFCTDFQNDAQNCNGCGNVCPLTNDICAGGQCQCPGALPTACGNTCVDTLTDPSHCGPRTDPATSCAHVCPLSNDVCVDGACTCPPTLPDACPGACVDLRTDEQNCGTCGERCPTEATCAGTTPRCECPAAAPTLCGHTGTAAGACVDTRTDARNCGGCAGASGTTCATSHACCASQCCPGTGACCAGGGCETEHFNGVNANYYDCGQLNQWTAEQAHLAAAAWMPTGTNLELVPNCGNPSCLCREGVAAGTTRTDAAVWCYQGSGPLSGFVVVTQGARCQTAFCPFASPPATVWH